jgi:hypothetical protein
MVYLVISIANQTPGLQNMCVFVYFKKPHSNLSKLIHSTASTNVKIEVARVKMRYS